MATKKKQGTLKKMERAVDEYVVQPVKKLVGLDTKSKKRAASAGKKRSTASSKAKPGTSPRKGVNAGKTKPATTSRGGGVTRRTAGTGGSRSR